ncbi:MAG: flavin reductase family protein [Clostridia bacterium]|nr:flavin reductase family protein [Clostridia bacterium]
MRKNFGAKPYCYPQPVFILAAYDENGVPCAMNAAWGGISEESEISLCISPEHKTTKNILVRSAFTVSMATAAQVAACDYVGIVSGNDVPDKFARAGFHAAKAEHVDAPMIEELPMALECRLIAYDPHSCRLVGEIVNVCADESVLDEKGQIDVRKLDPITFDPVSMGYLRLGERVGNAFADGGQIGCTPVLAE